jgi:hypothetical protein
LDKIELFKEIENNQSNIRFERFCKVVESFGFLYKGGKGSHKIYSRKGIEELVNIQNVKGQAKPYQIKQFIKLVKKYNLLGE